MDLDLEVVKPVLLVSCESYEENGQVSKGRRRCPIGVKHSLSLLQKL